MLLTWLSTCDDFNEFLKIIIIIIGKWERNEPKKITFHTLLINWKERKLIHFRYIPKTLFKFFSSYTFTFGNHVIHCPTDVLFDSLILKKYLLFVIRDIKYNPIIVPPPFFCQADFTGVEMTNELQIATTENKIIIKIQEVFVYTRRIQIIIIWLIEMLNVI